MTQTIALSLVSPKQCRHLMFIKSGGIKHASQHSQARHLFNDLVRTIYLPIKEIVNLVPGMRCCIDERLLSSVFCQNKGEKNNFFCHCTKYESGDIALGQICPRILFATS